MGNRGEPTSLVPFVVLYAIFLAPVITSLWEDFRHPQANDGILPLNVSFSGFLVWQILIHTLYFVLRAVCRILGWKVRAEEAIAHGVGQLFGATRTEGHARRRKRGARPASRPGALGA